jgi:uncharacterized metal-binding protein YceD (DUF177 family)
MQDGLPMTHVYNLVRLGQAGDAVRFAAGPDECAAIARWSGVNSVEDFSADIRIRKLSPSRFVLDVTLSADVTQSCVLTLEPVPDHIERRFTRELHFAGPLRRESRMAQPEPSILRDPHEDEPPEEIESLQYELAGPVLEEYVLSLEPYPRAKGAEFGLPSSPQDRQESPFAVLKDLKSKS